MKQNPQKSFTLLELLVVIAVIAILAAVVLVSLSGAQQQAREGKGIQFSQNIRTANSTDLVGEWRFDDGSDPGKDSSGHDNDGTVYNGAVVCNDYPTPPAGCPVWTSDGKVRGAL